MSEHFGDRLADSVKTKNSVLCGGLDPQLRFMPRHLVQAAVDRYGRTYRAVGEVFLNFNTAILEAISPYVAVVKPQAAFYEAYGSEGIRVLEHTLTWAANMGLLRITDAKRNDGGDTADAYAGGHVGMVPFFGESELTEIHGPLRTDAVTVTPYIGDDCVTRFAKANEDHGTGTFVVCKTSFKPNSRIEQLLTDQGWEVWQEVAHMIDGWGANTKGTSGYRSVGAVLGATYPEDAPRMRKRLPHSWFLVPGYGGQGGTANDAVAGINPDGLGCVVNSSRGIIYAYRSEKYRTDPENFAEAAAIAARDARDELNVAINKRLGR